MSRGRPKYKVHRKKRPPCPLDGKTVMSLQHAKLIHERDPGVEPYLCSAGYYHVGNVSKHPGVREQL
ncbi:MAG: hypothetical protein O3B04_09710 [Chloroflexi bacterium]|nr:hypothetical protein [Chloroflexota bacterium]